MKGGLKFGSSNKDGRLRDRSEGNEDEKERGKPSYGSGQRRLVPHQCAVTRAPELHAPVAARRPGHCEHASVDARQHAQHLEHGAAPAGLRGLDNERAAQKHKKRD